MAGAVLKLRVRSTGVRVRQPQWLWWPVWPLTSSLGSDGSTPMGAVRTEGFSARSTLPGVPGVSDDTSGPWGTEPTDSRWEDSGHREGAVSEHGQEWPQP